MDNYTKMCSLLPELQETKDKNLRRLAIPLEDSGIGLDDGGYNFLVCPDFEQLIGMLGNRDWDLKKMMDLYRARTDDDDFEEVKFYSNNYKIAMLKLVAWELWGKTWNEDKKAWEDTNGE